MEKHETLEVVARDYCIAYRSGDTVFYFSPATSSRANLFNRTPVQKRRRIEAMARYKREHCDGALSFNVTEEDPYAVFREAVKRREGFYKLADFSPGDAFRGVEYRGNTVDGNVASKKRRSASSPTFYSAVIKGVNLEDERIALSDISCSCNNHVTSTEKGFEQRTRVLCFHADALLQFFDEETKRGGQDINFANEFIPRTLPFHPFTFTRNWVFDPRIGAYRPQNRSLASLEYEINWDYYVLRENSFSINNALLHDPAVARDIVSEELREALNRGEARFELLRQDTKEDHISGAESRRRVSLYRDVKRVLAEHGYKFAGYCLEYGLPARRFESAENVVNLLHSDGLLYYVSKRKSPKRPDTTSKTRESGFYGRIGFTTHSMDDSTRTESVSFAGIPTRVFVPEAQCFITMDVPEITKKRYRNVVERESSAPSKLKRLFRLE